MGNPEKALKHYYNALQIREELAQIDPSNMGWQYDLSIGFTKVGDVYMGHGKFREAQIFFNKSILVVEQLVKKDPAITSWQSDLAGVHQRLAFVEERVDHYIHVIPSDSPPLRQLESIIKNPTRQNAVHQENETFNLTDADKAELKSILIFLGVTGGGCIVSFIIKSLIAETLVETYSNLMDWGIVVTVLVITYGILKNRK